jgi:hypothetical protein
MAGGRLRSPASRTLIGFPVRRVLVDSPACRAPAGFPVRRALIGVAVAAVAAAGCSSAGAHPASASSASRVRTNKAVTSCGTTRTAANVPVRIHVQRGPVSCTTAMAVERDYASAIAAGREPGNGGGGPVQVHGWTCQGFATPVVLRTGYASKCVQGGAEILAILPAPA